MRLLFISIAGHSHGGGMSHSHGNKRKSNHDPDPDESKSLVVSYNQTHGENSTEFYFWCAASSKFLPLLSVGLLETVEPVYKGPPNNRPKVFTIDMC